MVHRSGWGRLDSRVPGRLSRGRPRAGVALAHLVRKSRRGAVGVNHSDYRRSPSEEPSPRRRRSAQGPVRPRADPERRGSRHRRRPVLGLVPAHGDDDVGTAVRSAGVRSAADEAQRRKPPCVAAMRPASSASDRQVERAVAARGGFLRRLPTTGGKNAGSGAKTGDAARAALRECGRP